MLREENNDGDADDDADGRNDNDNTDNDNEEKKFGIDNEVVKKGEKFTNNRHYISNNNNEKFVLLAGSEFELECLDDNVGQKTFPDSHAWIWQRNGKELTFRDMLIFDIKSVKNGKKIHVNNASILHNANYTCSSQNKLGIGLTSKQITVQVNRSPKVEIVQNNNKNGLKNVMIIEENILLERNKKFTIDCVAQCDPICELNWILPTMRMTTTTQSQSSSSSSTSDNISPFSKLKVSSWLTNDANNKQQADTANEDASNDMITNLNNKPNFGQITARLEIEFANYLDLNNFEQISQIRNQINETNFTCASNSTSAGKADSKTIKLQLNCKYQTNRHTVKH